MLSPLLVLLLLPKLLFSMPQDAGGGGEASLDSEPYKNESYDREEKTTSISNDQQPKKVVKHDEESTKEPNREGAPPSSGQWSECNQQSDGESQRRALPTQGTKKSQQKSEEQPQRKHKAAAGSERQGERHRHFGDLHYSQDLGQFNAGIELRGMPYGGAPGHPYGYPPLHRSMMGGDHYPYSQHPSQYHYP